MTVRRFVARAIVGAFAFTIAYAGPLSHASAAKTTAQTKTQTKAQTKAHGFAGLCSYYSESRKVARGGRFNPNGLTAAHRTLPFGTRVRVTDPRTGKSVVVTINDRGPFRHRGRVLDVSPRAARALGMIGRGVIYVRAEIL